MSTPVLATPPVPTLIVNDVLVPAVTEAPVPKPVTVGAVEENANTVPIARDES